MMDPERETASALPQERQRAILNRLNREGRVFAANLAKEFETSEDTIRRDLRELAAAGLCQRVYGGALPISPDIPITVRRAETGARKRALGAGLAALIRPGQFVFFDVGSTNLAAAQALSDGLGITVATHDPAIAASLVGKPGVELILLGGRVDPHTGAALSAATLRLAMEMRPDLLLLGACALDPAQGIASAVFDDSEMKRLLVRGAGAVASAVGNHKLGVGASHLIAPTDALSDLVVEADAPDAPVDSLRALGLRVHRAATVKD